MRIRVCVTTLTFHLNICRQSTHLPHHAPFKWSISLYESVLRLLNMSFFFSYMYILSWFGKVLINSHIHIIDRALLKLRKHIRDSLLKI